MSFCKHIALIIFHSSASPCVKIPEVSSNFFPPFLVIAVLEIASLDIWYKLASVLVTFFYTKGCSFFFFFFITSLTSPGTRRDSCRSTAFQEMPPSLNLTVRGFSNPEHVRNFWCSKIKTSSTDMSSSNFLVDFAGASLLSLFFLTSVSQL